MVQKEFTQEQAQEMYEALKGLLAGYYETEEECRWEAARQAIQKAEVK